MAVTLRVDVQLPHPLGLEEAALKRAAAESLRVSIESIQSLRMIRKSLDARRKLKVPSWNLTLEVELAAASNAKPKPSANARPPPKPKTWIEAPQAPADAPGVIIVGAGPAGLFAAWRLAESGAKVTLVERGKPVETRARDFGRFRGRGELDPESNLCFGEGGAGTYSDGKLTTRKNDPRVKEVLERLVQVGAPERILIDAKPHIGTNLLFGILKKLRATLLDRGVKILFQTRAEQLRLRDGQLEGLDTTEGQLSAPRVVLAIGHSARDTFERLLSQGIPIEPKPFAVGVRAEHPQLLIDDAQYRSGRPRPKTLPSADYRLACDVDGRGVYSFCMCPGGMIVPTATEPNTVVVNGMSTARRSSPYANSGLVVQVELQDIVQSCGEGPLSGVAFQRMLEKRCFEAGGRDYKAPAMRASDLLNRRAPQSLASSNFRPGLVATDLSEVLPKFVMKGLQASLKRFDQQLRGYASEDANLIAVESRTSSPIRIPRDPQSLQVPGFQGLYVAGEGPGYAGGIMSAAVDGLKVAHAVLESMTQ